MAACIGILNAVLNKLALHVGRHKESTKLQDPHFHSKPENSTNTILLASGQHERKPKREDVVYSMLKMHAVLACEYKPITTICEFYSAIHRTPRDFMLKDEAPMALTFELLLTFAMGFEIIPSFMDRLVSSNSSSSPAPGLAHSRESYPHRQKEAEAARCRIR